jgi:hypothetical protein
MCAQKKQNCWDFGRFYIETCHFSAVFYAKTPSRGHFDTKNPPKHSKNTPFAILFPAKSATDTLCNCHCHYQFSLPCTQYNTPKTLFYMKNLRFRHSYTFSECDTACSGSGSGLSGSGSGSGSGGGPTHVEGTSLPIDPLYRPELHDELITGVRLVAPRGGPAAWVAVALALAVAIFFFFFGSMCCKKKKKKN